MGVLTWRAAQALVALTGVGVGEAVAQSNIPLQLIGLKDGSQRLQINVGINGGASQPYLFDTGSALFNAAYNPAWWGGVPSSSSLARDVQYCYGNGAGGCRGFIGNLVQVPSLSFGNNVTLAANPGYVVNAAYQYMVPAQGSVPAINISFPSYFATSSAPFDQAFYGVFGAGNFANLQQTGIAPPGGVLGQTMVPTLAQGYAVAVNNGAMSQGQGQRITVTVGGTAQPVTSCSPCVTLGLTPQMLGQFIPVGLPATNPFAGSYPVNRTLAGVVPVRSGPSFANPYGGGQGNNGSTQFGANFNMTLSAPGQGPYSRSTPTLIDTGTPGLTLTTNATGLIGNGTALTAIGLTPDGLPIPGLPAYTATLNSDNATYTAALSQGNSNTFGISFFLQNSVMFDLSDNAIGYTPFFVTDANLATTANGPLTVDGTTVPLGLAGVISGPGGVMVNSGGALQLSATNTYTGPTTIATGGLLYISGPGSIAASSGVTNNGIFDISRAWSPVAIQALNGAGAVYLGAQNLTITNANGTFSGTIADNGGAFPASGGSLTIAGGQQVLSGVNTYTGATTVSGGWLVLNGSIAGNMYVGANGMLTGGGVIQGNYIHGGVVSPGNSIGVLAVLGNHVQTAGSVYLADVSATGTSDLIKVNGTAAIQGATLVANPQAGSFGPRTAYTILTAAGGVSGSYANVLSTSPFLVPSLGYDANDVYLTLQIGGFAAAAQNPTQYAVGQALDISAPTATGDYATVLGTLATQSTAQVLPVLTSLSGMNYSGFSSSMVQGAQLFMNNFLAQASAANRGQGKVALAEACDVACDTGEPAKWGAWGGALGGLGTVGAGQSLGGLTYNVGGFAAGLDRKVTDNFLAGVTVGFTSGSQWVSGFTGQGFSNTFQAGLYGSYAQGPLYVDGLAGYAYSSNQLSRSILIPGLAARVATGQAGANQAYGQLETGWRFDIGTAAEAFVTPFARLQGYTGTQNSFTESGAQSLDLSVAAQTTSSLRTVVGAQVGGAMDVGWREKLGVQLRLGWSHEYADTARPVSASFVGAPAAPFTTYGVSPQRDGAVVGFSANTAIAAATSAYLRYEGNISGQDSSHALTAGVRMTW